MILESENGGSSEPFIFGHKFNQHRSSTLDQPRQPREEPAILQDCVQAPAVNKTHPVTTALVAPPQSASRPTGNSRPITFTLALSTDK